MTETYLVPETSAFFLFASFVIASLSGYATLDLNRRIHDEHAVFTKFWWVGGSLVLGTGIWSMHFVGMQGFMLPIPMGYGKGLTFVSWVVVVLVAAMALSFKPEPEFSSARLAVWSVLMGGGISAMHYLGMAAMDMVPGIQWKWELVAASVVVAIVSSAVVMKLEMWIRRVNQRRLFRYQLGASCLIGLGIWLMHNIAMQAAQFPVGSVCLSAGQLGGPRVAEFGFVITALLLGITISTTTLERHLKSHSARIIRRLENEVAELELKAFSDPLTGLPNRALLLDRISHALARTHLPTQGSRRTLDSTSAGLRVALVFIDLDGFKPINDTYGHAVGDLVLVQIAQRLTSMVRDCDTVARLGGDEFVLLLEDVVDVASCEELAQRVIHSLCEPMHISGKTLQVSASLGIAVSPDHGDADTLMDNADLAMYQAKRTGGSNYVVYGRPGNSGLAAL